MANEKSNERESGLLNKYFNKGTTSKVKNSSGKNVKEEKETHVNPDLTKSPEGSKRKLKFSSFRIKKGKKQLHPENEKIEVTEMNGTTLKNKKTPQKNNLNEINHDDLQKAPTFYTKNGANQGYFLNTTDINTNLNMTGDSYYLEKGTYKNSSVRKNSSFRNNPSAGKYEKLEFNSTNATPSNFSINMNKNNLGNYIHDSININETGEKKTELLYVEHPQQMWNTTSPSLNMAHYNNSCAVNSLDNNHVKKGSLFLSEENNKYDLFTKKQKKISSSFNDEVNNIESNRKIKSSVVHGNEQLNKPKNKGIPSEHGQIKYISANKEYPYYKSNEMEENPIYINKENIVDLRLVQNNKVDTQTIPQDNIRNAVGNNLYVVKDGEMDKSKIIKVIYNDHNNTYDIVDMQKDLNITNGMEELNDFLKAINNNKSVEKGTIYRNGIKNELIPQPIYTPTEKYSYNKYQNKIPIHSLTKNNKSNIPTSCSEDITELTYDFEDNTITNEPDQVNSNVNIGGKSLLDYRNLEKEHKQRGSFNYSGLLTSMVSSILSQQNEMKMKENISNRDNIFKNNLNYHMSDNYSHRYSHNINTDNSIRRSYEYTLLHNMVDNKQKDKMAYHTTQNELEKGATDKLLILTLIIMIFISVLCNYDHGAIPVTLGEIQKDFPLSYIEQSLLGSLVYFGLIIGTIIAGVLFELLPAKMLVCVSVISLSVSLYIFSHANCIMFMYISRFVNGLCQAIPVVYLPVWVDEFSPDENATQWMSYIQLASIGGTVFGYFLGGILSNIVCYNNRKDPVTFPLSIFFTWRSPFLIQAFLLVPIFLTLIFIPSDTINIMSNYSEIGEPTEENNSWELQNREGILESQKECIKKLGNNYSNTVYKNGHKYSLLVTDTNNNKIQQNETKNLSVEKQHNIKERMNEFKNSRSRMNFNRSATYIMEKKTNVLKKTFKEVKKLLKNKLYIIITLGMSNLYFVVTGIQFWITEYMSVVLLTEKIKIVTVSTLCFLTSPTSGVWFGGYICDFFGGYKNTNYSKTIKVATAFAIAACIFGILSAHLNNFILFSVCLWLCLFNGSALVPVAVGMLLSCVDNHQKSLSSAVSQIIYNVFGWFSAPLLSGALMDLMHKYTDDRRMALKAGFMMILYSSIVGFILLLYANFIDLSDKKVIDDANELVEPLK